MGLGLGAAVERAAGNTVANVRLAWAGTFDESRFG